MRQIHDKKNSQAFEHHDLTTVPGPLVTKNLIKNSFSDIFDQAKQEWELVSHIPSDSFDFVENCELCNSQKLC